MQSYNHFAIISINKMRLFEVSLLSFRSLKEQKKASPDGMHDALNPVDAFVNKWFAVEPKFFNAPSLELLWCVEASIVPILTGFLYGICYKINGLQFIDELIWM